MNTFTNSSILSNLPATSHEKRQGSAVAYGSVRLREVPALLPWQLKTQFGNLDYLDRWSRSQGKFDCNIFSLKE